MSAQAPIAGIVRMTSRLDSASAPVQASVAHEALAATAPTGFLAGHGAPRPLEFVPSSRGLQLSSLAMHEWLGIAWYRFKGHIRRTP